MCKTKLEGQGHWCLCKNKAKTHCAIPRLRQRLPTNTTWLPWSLSWSRNGHHYSPEQLVFKKNHPPPYPIGLLKGN